MCSKSGTCGAILPYEVLHFYYIFSARRRRAEKSDYLEIWTLYGCFSAAKAGQIFFIVQNNLFLKNSVVNTRLSVPGPAGRDPKVLIMGIQKKHSVRND